MRNEWSCEWVAITKKSRSVWVRNTTVFPLWKYDLPPFDTTKRTNKKPKCIPRTDTFNYWFVICCSLMPMHIHFWYLRKVFMSPCICVYEATKSIVINWIVISSDSACLQQATINKTLHFPAGQCWPILKTDFSEPDLAIKYKIQCRFRSLGRWMSKTWVQLLKFIRFIFAAIANCNSPFHLQRVLERDAAQNAWNRSIHTLRCLFLN